MCREYSEISSIPATYCHLLSVHFNNHEVISFSLDCVQLCCRCPRNIYHLDADQYLLYQCSLCRFQRYPGYCESLRDCLSPNCNYYCGESNNIYCCPGLCVSITPLPFLYIKADISSLAFELYFDIQIPYSPLLSRQRQTVLHSQPVSLFLFQLKLLEALSSINKYLRLLLPLRV